MEYSEFKSKFHIVLNQQQEAAVQKVQGPVLLLAVPGSGKTTVLITRLGYMLFCCGIRPDEILTTTYTKAATQDMRPYLGKNFGIGSNRSALSRNRLRILSGRFLRRSGACF